MKNRVHFMVFIAILFSIQCKAQSIAWANVFDLHENNVSNGIYPNSVISNSGKITTVVTENDTLKLYQTLADGTISNMLNTNNTAKDYHTPLIATGSNELSLVYETLPYPGVFRLLQTDSNLNITRNAQLQLPAEISVFKVGQLIHHSNQLYVTLFSNQKHYLLKINPDDSVMIVYSGNLPINFENNLTILNNGNFVFSYVYGNSHIVRCVLPLPEMWFGNKISLPPATFLTIPRLITG